LIFKEISRVLGRFFLYFTAVLALPLMISVIYVDEQAIKAFFITLLISLVTSFLFKWGGRKSKGKLYRKESILLVSLIWFLTAGIAALPFIISKTIPNPLDAYFESMSGLTTTGATIIHPKTYDPATGIELPISIKNPFDPAIIYTFEGTVPPLRDAETGVILKEGIEALGKPLLFWRSFLQWLGGMGIVVLFIAVLPALAMGGKFLFENEIPGPTKEGITPRVQETAGFLWKIYLVLTLAQTGLLMFTNHAMPFFDAITLSFSTISTGGFTVTNDGLLSYHSLPTNVIITIFMLLGSLNFTLYFHALRGKIYRLYEPELIVYIFTLFIACALMSLSLWNTPKFFHTNLPGYFSFTEALALGSFQAISSQTSTGFSLVNYDLWPFSCQLLMIVLMYIGGMSGSTTGGIKVIRYAIVLRVIKNKIESLFRPESVRTLQIGHKEVSSKTAMTVLTFFCIVIAFVILGSYLLVLDNNDPQTAVGIISCMINNTGLSFGGIGCLGSFAFLPTFSKIVSILWMVLGRLEYFSLLVLFAPSFWKK
jgi:trk system potassium uptake protein TrkH